jgi:heme/copper-type cytochrome/quinol oxidase subunit 2
MKLQKTFYILIASLILLPNNISSAQEYNFNENSGLKESADSGGFLDTLFDSSKSINTAISRIITTVLSFLGVIFLVLIIVAGYQWMTAGGNEEQVTKAREKLKNSIIGLVIVLAAYAITMLVISLLTTQTLTN